MVSLTRPLFLLSAVAALLSLSVGAALAEAAREEGSTASYPLVVPVMPPVVVVGSMEPVAMTGETTLDRDLLEAVPAGVGTLNDYLKLLPGVQGGEAARSSAIGGEIAPPPVSISGGKFYENNFRIDGFGNNSLLDPAFVNPRNPDNVPGNPQAFFIDPELLEGVEVYRSNVPARFGGFTGGVVDARTRRPAEAFGGRGAFRTTRSQWTRFHVDEAEEEEFEDSRSEANQPRFRKEEFKLTVDLPVSDRAGALLHASFLRSRIPLEHLDGTEVQRRELLDLFAKILLRPAPWTEWTLSAFWAPYESEYFLENVRESRYTIEQGGFGLNTAARLLFPIGAWEVGGGYQENSNSREAPHEYFTWGLSATRDWGAKVGEKSSREGGHGDIDKLEKTLSLQSHFTTEPMRTGPLSHTLTAGLEYQRTTGSFERSEFYANYSGAVLNDQVVCEPGDRSCLPQEQFLTYKTVYAPDRAKVAIDFYEGYLEDRMTLGRFSLRPGLRFSRNDLMDNNDLAPRLGAAYDLFGDGRTVLLAGINRYYGKTLLAHAIAEKKKPYTVWSRPTALDAGNLPQPWQERRRTVIGATRLADLDTPYADEVTAGVGQSLLAGRLDLLFIDRRGGDELTTRVLKKDADGYIYTEWTNEGRTRHHEFSLSWERQWQRHFLLLNATWQKTIASHVDYQEIYRGDEEAPVWYHGRILERWELPAPDYNRRWTANAVYRTALPLGFSFTNVTRYRSGYRALEKTTEKMTVPDGRVLDVYDEVENAESWIFDWRLAWSPPLPAGGIMTLSLDVLNVFDEGRPVGGDSTEFEIGRQFWAAAEYRF